MIISILSGGSGTRLFPLSRSNMPKQFIELVDGSSLFTKTLKRNCEILSKDDKVQIITNEAHYFLASDSAKLAGVGISKFILETNARNTAPALIISALLANKDEIILSIPSDHIIENIELYKESVEKAKALANAGHIVIFGIKPTLPHTGYGYIESSDKIDENGFYVKAFHEKPNLEKAKEYLASGKYYWNSGMFCYKASILIDEIKLYQKDLYNQCVKIVEKLESNLDYALLDRELSKDLQDISIDYALMEKTKKLAMVEATFDWNDVGSFDSLSSVWKKTYNKDSSDNLSNGLHEGIDSKNNIIHSHRAVATIGLNDFFIIDTMDALLIAKRGETQGVKHIVERLKKRDSNLVEFHNRVHRPWGYYNVLLESNGYKLKSICVKPKHRLSLQKHYHRNEHWIVVSGSAIVQVGNDEIFLKPNESTYIPMGCPHRLSNMGNIDLIIVEVQVGEYLGEDDIVRMEDDYKR